MKKRTKRNKIVFYEELVTKHGAEEMVYNMLKNETAISDSNVINLSKTKGKKRKLSHKLNTDDEVKSTKNPVEQISASNQIGKDNSDCENPETEVDVANIVSKSEESKRSLKRKKHTQFLQDKQLKLQMAQQQRCLNYLILWKHSKNEWKFEKLRQVWLQQNMFDCNKIPDSLFDTLIEYFVNASSSVRKSIVKSAVKIIEAEELDSGCTNKENLEVLADSEKKFKRAKVVIQILEE